MILERKYQILASLLTGSKLHLFASAIRVEHTLFALPFAYIGMFLAADGWPGWDKFIWITVAMAGARTVAMAANRVVHQKEDAANPRTAGRHLPRGLLGKREMIAAMVVSVAVFFFVASQLNNLALALAPVALAAMVLYNYAKYFTWLCHLILGWTDAIAPAGAWIGVTGSLDPEAVVLAAGVALWIGGFDVIYACMDYDFDKSYGTHSIPRQFGIPGALLWAKVMHLGASAALLAVGIMLELNAFYYAAWVGASALLVYQNAIVKPNDLSRANVAALKINTYVGLILLAGVSLAVFL
ncbi:MAG: 4-hydroxybenzoate octaprenyltransferase [SAR202 cluster bacterium]|nr:4-hydroxybenzoate octaprenyltransferase [SAR202 cluster bacterium]